MKSSKADVAFRAHKIPDVVFEDAEGQKLTSFGGLVIYCFAHKKVAPIYDLHRNMLVMMLNAILGYLGTSEKRRPLWTFESLSTIRQRLVQHAARLIRPQGRLTLVMGANDRVREEIERHLKLA